MEEIVLALFNKYGAWGLIIAYAGWKVLMPVYKKRTGSWVSYHDMEKRMREVQDKVDKLELEFEKMKSAQEQINKSLFARMDQLHDSLIGIRETADRHFTMMMDAISKIKGGR